MSAEVEIDNESSGPAELRWEGLNFDVKGRRLLNNVTGSIKGQVMAIMGKFSHYYCSQVSLPKYPSLRS
jgi:hypothetical protein